MKQIRYTTMERDSLPCPVCESPDFDTLARVDRYGMGIPTCQCRRCGLAMTNPAPSERALATFYRDDYRLYYRKTEVPSEQHIEEYGLGVRAAHTAAFLQQQGLLAGEPHVLDVGCAEGSLLRAIGALAPASVRVGVEPNPKFGAYARTFANATVHTDLSDVERTTPQFDLIVVNHVLEHVREPVPFLERLAQLCRPSGVVYIDVPDAARYRSIDDLHLAHLYHFTAMSLANLLGRARFAPVSIDKHAPKRHPLSVRALARAGAAPHAWQVDQEAPVVRQQIRRIARLAPAFAFRRSVVGRLLFNVPLRILRSRSGVA